MDFELTEEQRAFAQTARDFAQAEFAPHAAHWDEEGIFPREAIAKAGEPGFCGLFAPEAPGAPPPSSPSTTWPPGCWAPGPRPPCATTGARCSPRVKNSPATA